VPRPIVADSPRAWIAAFAAAAANGFAFGTAYTFGTFFESMADDFGTERGSTALLFGTTLLFFFGFGIVSGPLSDRFGQQRLLLTGGVLFVSGVALTAQVDSLAVGFLTYGIGVGIGSGCFVAPLTAYVGQLFVRHRALALGVVATGNGIGTLVLSPLAARLIDAEDWRYGYTVIAIAGAVVFAIALPAVWRPPDPRIQPAADPTTADVSFVRLPAFRALFVSGMLMSIGLFVAFAFVVPFATDEGISSSGASRLVAVIGLSSIAGRLSLTNATSRFGAVRVYQGALAIQPIAYLIWLVAGGNYALLVTFAVVLGVSYGGFVAVAPAVVIELFGTAGLGRKMGTVFFSSGLGGFIGPPVAGFVADATSGRSTPIVLVIAVLLVALAATAPLGRPGRAPSGDVSSRTVA
jgi:predicted MFS family arabinose efflux permease